MGDWKNHLSRGQVIPACPLALFEDGTWSEAHQRALIRYYLDSGAGGLAVGVHSTQFEIRDPQHALFEPVLELAAETVASWCPPDRTFIKIAGICGDTPQALREVETAQKFGYHAGLLSLTAFKSRSDKDALTHCRAVADQFPIIGFYLQPAVGGRHFGYSFWRQFAEIENAVAIKIAPFNRYQTLDVVRAVIDSGRDDIALYTGNDDNIIADLLTPFTSNGTTRHIVGGLLGHWGIWTKRAAGLFDSIRPLRDADSIPSRFLQKNAAVTDMNAAVFDAAHQFAGCIPGIMEVLHRQHLVPSTRCLDSNLTLSPGQAEEIDRVCRTYPEYTDDDFVAENLHRWLS